MCLELRTRNSGLANLKIFFSIPAKKKLNYADFYVYSCKISRIDFFFLQCQGCFCPIALSQGKKESLTIGSRRSMRRSIFFLALLAFFDFLSHFFDFFLQQTRLLTNGRKFFSFFKKRNATDIAAFFSYFKMCSQDAATLQGTARPSSAHLCLRPVDPRELLVLVPGDGGGRPRPRAGAGQLVAPAGGQRLTR